MSLMLVSQFRGVSIPFPRLNLWSPWLWLIGVCIFSTGLSVAGVLGEPRRTNLGLMHNHPAMVSHLKEWYVWDTMGAIGGILMFVSTLLFFINFFAVLLMRPKEERGRIRFPTSEAHHNERLPWFENFRPWVALMIVAIAFAYVPPI
jgi:cytochrome c oxidase subunit 1